MNSHEVKEELISYRPEDHVPNEPATAEALRQAGSDPELQRWLDHQGAFHRQMEESLAGIEVPVGLKERILDSARTEPKIVRFPRRMFVPLALAAGLAVVAGLTIWHQTSSGKPFDAYRERMARVVLRDYRMNMVSRSQAEIRK